MQEETLLSVGIDIGTTTTHLICSRIGISVTGGFGTVPQAEITSKEILYKSPVYFTPLSADGKIDAHGVAALVRTEYEKANLTPEKIQSGAVIITRESACKENAEAVLQEIAAFSGNFVSAVAGSSLESYLAGKGAGADLLSAQTGKTVANVDIGGGTTNIAVFQNGECVGDSCLHIGGRVLKMCKDESLYISKPIAELCRQKGIGIPGFTTEGGFSNVKEICFTLAKLLFYALTGTKKEATASLLPILTVDHPLPEGCLPEIVTFSGGVAECIGKDLADFAFGDIGVLLARAIAQIAAETPVKTRVCASASPIRATVIGAGNFTLTVSGSTIHFDGVRFPICNLPCIKTLSDIDGTPCAICIDGEKSPSFAEVERYADDIVDAAKSLFETHTPLLVFTKYDFAKALGFSLRRRLPQEYPLLCADGVSCRTGDYLDVGTPIAEGRAVPITVKTLVFGG